MGSNVWCSLEKAEREVSCVDIVRLAAVGSGVAREKKKISTEGHSSGRHTVARACIFYTLHKLSRAAGLFGW